MTTTDTTTAAPATTPGADPWPPAVASAMHEFSGLVRAMLDAAKAPSADSAQQDPPHPEWIAAHDTWAAVMNAHHAAVTSPPLPAPTPLTVADLEAFTESTIVWATITTRKAWDGTAETWRGLVRVDGSDACRGDGSRVGNWTWHPLSALSDVYAVGPDPVAEVTR